MTIPAPPLSVRRRTRLRFAPHLVALLAAIAVLGACAPGTGTGGPTGASDPAFATPLAQQVETSAQEAYHRMEIGRLRSGAYTTAPLVDLALPQGARWTVIAFGEADYTLRFSSDALPGIAWEVSPGGVRRVRG